MSISTPVINAPNMYVDNMLMTWVSTTTMTVSPGIARDSTNTNDISVGLAGSVAGSETGEEPVLAGTGAVTINTAIQGAGGIDQGTIAASTFYAVHAIGDSYNGSPGSALISLSAIAPVLPSGYDMFRRIGYILTDGSSHILKFWQYGNSHQRPMYYDVAIAALSAGASTTYAAVSLVASVPIGNVQAIMLVEYTPSSAADVAHFIPFGSTATNGVQRFGYGVAAIQTGMLTVTAQSNAGVPTFQYKVENTDALTLLTAGYIDHI
jgi:hypothetical protein